MAPFSATRASHGRMCVHAEHSRTATLGASVLVRRRCETRDSLVRVSLRIRQVHSPQLISTCAKHVAVGPGSEPRVCTARHCSAFPRSAPAGAVAKQPCDAPRRGAAHLHQRGLLLAKFCNTHHRERQGWPRALCPVAHQEQPGPLVGHGALRPLPRCVSAGLAELLSPSPRARTGVSHLGPGSKHTRVARSWTRRRAAWGWCEQGAGARHGPARRDTCARACLRIASKEHGAAAAARVRRPRRATIRREPTDRRPGQNVRACVAYAHRNGAQRVRPTG